jgi:hypothetical protein
MMGLSKYGRLAQLGERGVRNAEAAGSNPAPSTTPQFWLYIKNGFNARMSQIHLPRVASR